MLRRVYETDTVHLESLAEPLVLPVVVKPAVAMPLEESRLHRIGKAVRRGAFPIGYHAVNQQVTVGQQPPLLVAQMGSRRCAHTHHITAYQQAGETLRLPNSELVVYALLAEHDRRNQIHLCACRQLHQCIHHIAPCLPPYFLPADGRIGLAYAGKEQLQVIVYLRNRPHRGAWVAARYLLLNSDSRRDALYLIHLRLLHPAEELPRIGAQALHIAALPFGIERIERQRRLAAAAHARYHHQLVARDVHRHAFQVMGLRILNMDKILGHYLFLFNAFSFSRSITSRVVCRVVSRCSVVRRGIRIGVPTRISFGLPKWSLLAS